MSKLEKESVIKKLHVNPETLAFSEEFEELKTHESLKKTPLNLEVCIAESEDDVERITNKILKLEIPGLTWKKEDANIRVEPAGFGVKRLTISSLIEESKVNVANVKDKIEGLSDAINSVFTSSSSS